MNYSEYKEGTQESYEELYQELGTLLRMTGYLTGEKSMQTTKDMTFG